MTHTYIKLTIILLHHFSSTLNVNSELVTDKNRSAIPFSFVCTFCKLYWYTCRYHCVRPIETLKITIKLLHTTVEYFRHYRTSSTPHAPTTVENWNAGFGIQFLALYFNQNFIESKMVIPLN